MATSNTEAVTTNGNHEYLDKDYGSDDALRKIRTAGSISISPDLFEKLYLAPEKKVKGELRKTFGNPTPIGISGFILSLTPLACDLLGWRGAGGGGAAEIGVYYGCGAILMLVGGLLEFFLGNTFPAVVFMTFGAYWFAFAGTLTPSFGAFAAYSSDPTGKPTAGLTTPGFQASFAFFLLSMGILCLIYLIASVRTNAVFLVIFLTLTFGFCLIAGAYWQLAEGNMAMGQTLQTASGSFLFVTILCGWYLFLVQILASVDFPINLPVFDMSTMIKGQTERLKAKEAYSAA